MQKMIPVEAVPGMGEGGWGRKMERGNSSMVYLIQCKNLVKCWNVPTPAQQ
jgi:hypothetical protein